MNEKLAAAKAAVVRNKTRILVTTTVMMTAAVAIQARGLHMHNEFLREHDLYDEYYTPDADE